LFIAGHAGKQVNVYHAGKAHEPGLQEYYHYSTGDKVVVQAIVVIAYKCDVKDRHVPQQIEEKDHYSKCIVDAAAIIAFVLHLVAANAAMINHCEALTKWKNMFINEHITFTAGGALHPE